MTSHLALPQRVYPHHKHFIYKPLVGKPINLGATIEEVHTNYERLVHKPAKPCHIPVGVARELWRKCKNSSKARGIPFELSYEDLVEMVSRAKGKCELTGIPFDVDWMREYRRQRRPWFPSIDRIDNKQGYTIANTRLVCIAVNIALNTFGQDVLIRIAHCLKTQRTWPTY